MQLSFFEEPATQPEERRERPPAEYPYRIVYSSAGRPTAALLPDRDAIIDTTLYWVPCVSLEEAMYLVAIINSTAMYERVAPLMSKGAFGPRHVEKQIWRVGGGERDLHKQPFRLGIPEYDPEDRLHAALAAASTEAAAEAHRVLRNVRISRQPRDDFGLYGAIVPAAAVPVSGTVARREIRDWMATAPIQQLVEDLVGRLLPEAA